MTDDEADIIFRSWTEYMETADKFNKLTLTPPESFLPYPVETLEDAMNIVAKRYFDAGDREASETIQSTMASHLTAYFLAGGTNRRLTDEEALEQMRRALETILDHPLLMKAVLDNLRESQKSWMKTRHPKS